MPSTRPQPEDYPTRATYRWALRNWQRHHGGSLFVLLAIALVFGSLSGSTAGVWLLVMFAIIAWVIARSRHGLCEQPPSACRCRKRRRIRTPTSRLAVSGSELQALRGSAGRGFTK